MVAFSTKYGNTDPRVHNSLLLKICQWKFLQRNCDRIAECIRIGTSWYCY